MKHHKGMNVKQARTTYVKGVRGCIKSVVGLELIYLIIINTFQGPNVSLACTRQVEESALEPGSVTMLMLGSLLLSVPAAEVMSCQERQPDTGPLKGQGLECRDSVRFEGRRQEQKEGQG